jgi:hypothetical protein
MSLTRRAPTSEKTQKAGEYGNGASRDRTDDLPLAKSDENVAMVVSLNCRKRPRARQGHGERESTVYVSEPPRIKDGIRLRTDAQATSLSAPSARSRAGPSGSAQSRAALGGDRVAPGRGVHHDSRPLTRCRRGTVHPHRAGRALAWARPAARPLRLSSDAVDVTAAMWIIAVAAALCTEHPLASTTRQRDWRCG